MLRVIVTGGTFEKRYDELNGVLTFGESHLPGLLRQSRVTLPVVLEVNQLIDSLDMTPADRERILASCLAAPEDRILIIHGTDTMVETARVLGEAALHHDAPGKTVVLAGAMVPYAILGSDAEFNLGFAFAAAQLLPPGVYIAMNGRVFPWRRAAKNRSLGIFEELPDPLADDAAPHPTPPHHTSLETSS